MISHTLKLRSEQDSGKVAKSWEFFSGPWSGGAYMIQRSNIGTYGITPLTSLNGRAGDPERKSRRPVCGETFVPSHQCVCLLSGTPAGSTPAFNPPSCNVHWQTLFIKKMLDCELAFPHSLRRSLRTNQISFSPNFSFPLAHISPQPPMHIHIYPLLSLPPPPVRVRHSSYWLEPGQRRP